MRDRRPTTAATVNKSGRNRLANRSGGWWASSRAGMATSRTPIGRKTVRNRNRPNDGTPTAATTATMVTATTTAKTPTGVTTAASDLPLTAINGCSAARRRWTDTELDGRLTTTVARRATTTTATTTTPATTTTTTTLLLFIL